MSPTQPAPPVKLTVDHVTIAGSSLEKLQTAFTAAGLTPDYGGPHSNGITHMALIGFDDGSYLELISSLQPGAKDTAFWGDFIVGDGGPCAWAVYVDDVAAEAERVKALGVSVNGPHYYNRRRPDGQLVEWDLAFLGDKSAGATVPFIIKDITARALRVQPSASVAGGPIAGVTKVVLGVKNLAAVSAQFQRLYRWPPPQTLTDHEFGASLLNFPGSPVILAAPLTDSDWLAARLSRFDEAPCAYLLGVTAFERASRQFKLTHPTDWFGQPVAWFDQDQLSGLRVGLVG